VKPLCAMLLATLLLCACGADDPPAEVATARFSTPQPEHAQASSPAPAPSPSPSGVTEAVEPSPPEPAGDPSGRAMFSPTPGTLMRGTELRAEPSLDAQILTELPARTAVTIVDRHGGWLAVVTDDARGWVRLLHVSSQPPGTHGPIPPELEQAARVATGREGGGNIVVTTGTRGLTEEELRQAQANTQELSRMEAQSVDARRAEDYAARHGLQRRNVAYPTDPQGENR
jgi:hypothetical protein